MNTMTTVRLSHVKTLTHSISLFGFEPIDAPHAPHIAFAAAPGTHIDVHLPNGMVRPYSLVHVTGMGAPYVVAVKKEPFGRGASRFLHEEIRIGTQLQVGQPRNNFELVEAAEHSIFIAGGIGITPMWNMLHRLDSLGRTWELHYACKSSDDAAFYDALKLRPQVRFYSSNVPNNRLDMAAVCSVASPAVHLYCCGPSSMMDAFEAATQKHARSHLHTEYFSSSSQAASQGGFAVELARSGVTLQVKAGERIIEVLRHAGVEVLASCEQGVCGSCETRVLSGEPDHRCQVLSAGERASNMSMMVCCSGSKSSTLVLDI